MKGFPMILCFIHKVVTCPVVIRIASFSSTWKQVQRPTVRYFCGTASCGSRCISDSLVYTWDSLPRNELICPALTWSFLPSPITSYYAMFGWYLCGAWNFWKEKEGKWIWGEGVERSGGSRKHEQDIFYEIRMYFQ